MGKPRLLSALSAAILIALLATPATAQFLEPDVDVLTTLSAEAPGDFFGFAGEALGDINGDGAGDYIIGAPQNSFVARFSGAAYVYSGADGSLLNTVRGGFLDFVGYAVSGGTDLDGDGVNDYLIGAPNLAGLPGRVLAYSGATHTLLWEKVDPPLTFLGYDVNITGDVDGDGRPDVVAGAPIDSTHGVQTGRVDVLSGVDGSVIWSTYGFSIGGNLGSAVGGLGDLNGDGVPEQGAGAVGVVREIGRNTVRGGAAWVLDGATGAFMRELIPNGTASAFGIYFISNAGDVDGDGTDDIYAGDYQDVQGGNVASGAAYVFSGATDDRLRFWRAENPGDGFGDGRGIFEDLDGDGHDDLVVASYLNSDGAPQAGKGYLLSGRTGKVLRTMTCLVPGALIGVDALSVGDVNSDGLADYLLTGFDISYVVAGVPEDDGVESPLNKPQGADAPPAAGREVLADRLDPDHMNLPEMEFRFGEH